MFAVTLLAYLYSILIIMKTIITSMYYWVLKMFFINEDLTEEPLFQGIFYLSILLSMIKLNSLIQ